MTDESQGAALPTNPPAQEVEVFLNGEVRPTARSAPAEEMCSDCPHPVSAHTARYREGLFCPYPCKCSKNYDSVVRAARPPDPPASLESSPERTTALDLLEHIQRRHAPIARKDYIECSCGTTFWFPDRVAEEQLIESRQRAIVAGAVADPHARGSIAGALEASAVPAPGFGAGAVADPLAPLTKYSFAEDFMLVDPDGAYYLAADVDQRLGAAQQQIAELQEQLKGRDLMLDDYQNREAACCPEDVGFDELIATLRKDAAAWRGRVSAAEASLRQHEWGAAFGHGEGRCWVCAAVKENDHCSWCWLPEMLRALAAGPSIGKPSGMASPDSGATVTSPFRAAGPSAGEPT